MPDPMTADRAARATAHDELMSRLLVEMQPRLRAFLRRLAGVDVDDAVQETMARAWRSRRSFDPGHGGVEPWLLRIAFRAFLDQRGRNGATAAEPGEVAGAEPDPAHLIAVRDHTAALLDRLSAIERDVLLRFHGDGESIERIAEALAMPRGTVKSHLHRARNRLWAMQHQIGDRP